jgi:hypothetical protein
MVVAGSPTPSTTAAHAVDTHLQISQIEIQ